MKKIFFLVFTVIFFVCHAFAQKERKIDFGLKGGFNHTVINGYETNGTKTGFVGSSIYGALFTEIHIGPTTFLGSELLFSWTNNWHFIEVPFHIKQMLNKRVSLFLGPKIDFAADKLDPAKESKSGTCGVSIEAGTQFNIINRLFIEGRYSFGLSNQFQDEFFDINDGSRNNLRFGVGFRF